MDEREFNLLEEPWIAVMRDDGGMEEVSLTEVFERAGAFRALAGEFATQNAAVLRLLLAVLHAVVSRFDEEGACSPLTSASAAVGRWNKLWKRKAFPMERIRDYLESYRDRFWLFDTQRPFYQVPNMPYGTKYSAAKLNGALSQSENKVRLFPQLSGDEQGVLSYGEAARWLVCIMAYDDASTKKQGDDKTSLGSMSVGWLGRFSVIQAEGRNLFETLMLNLVLAGEGRDIGAQEYPEWEHKELRQGQRVPTCVPDNLSQLYTVQSRRILLLRENGAVTGYIVYGGDEIENSNAFIEPMAAWKNIAKKNEPPKLIPERFGQFTQLWREFASLTAGVGGARKPGLVEWLAKAKVMGGLDANYKISFRSASVYYGNMMSSIDNVISDGVAFDANMLTQKGEDWVTTVTNALEQSKKLAEQLANLAQRVAKSLRDTDGYVERDAAKEKAYYRFDMPFREWLEGIDTEHDEQSEAEDRWWKAAQRMILVLGREMIAAVGPQALTGRRVKEKNGDQLYCAADAYNSFLYFTSSPQALMNGGKKNAK